MVVFYNGLVGIIVFGVKIRGDISYIDVEMQVWEVQIETDGRLDVEKENERWGIQNEKLVVQIVVKVTAFVRATWVGAFIAGSLW